MVSIRRLRRSRYSSWGDLDTSTLETMSIAHSDTSSRPRSRDTGFPETFCGNRNTTLPHPDADLSPNACISQDDVSMSRVLSRQRRSFLPKHKRNIKHGCITPNMEQMYGDTVAVASDSEEGSSTREIDGQLPTIPGTPGVDRMARPTSNGGDSFASASTGDHNDVAPKHHRFSTRLSTDSGASTRSSRRKGFFEKLGIAHQRRP